MMRSQLRFFHAYGRPAIVYVWHGSNYVSWTMPSGNSGSAKGYDLERVEEMVAQSRWQEIFGIDKKKAFDAWR